MVAIIENSDGSRYAVCHKCEGKYMKTRIVDRVNPKDLSDPYCASCHDLLEKAK